MMSDTAARAARHRARIAGVVYLLFFLCAAVSEVFLGPTGTSALATRDAATITQRIVEHQNEFRIGFAFSLLLIAFYVALTALLYQLLKPVSRSVALIATVFGLLGLTLQTVAAAFQLAAFTLLTQPAATSAFDETQLPGLAVLLLNLMSRTYSVGLIFDGLFQLGVAYLIVRSTFLPGVLGVALAVSGAGWLTLLWPPLAVALSPAIAIVGGVAELALMTWLLVRGIDGERWVRRSTAAHEMSQAGRAY